MESSEENGRMMDCKMLVTDIPYYMEPRLIAKLDLMIARCTQKKPAWDAVLLVEGGEGDGKTTMSGCCAKYVSYKTGRKFTHENIFFSVEQMIEFAQNTKEQIIIWDEPALEGLSAEWWKETQKNLIKLLMMARMNRHFFIFNITKFYKFAEYIIVDRALGMVHVYSRKNKEPGRFVYIKKKFIERLVNDYKRSKIRNYRKYTTFRGTFTDALDKFIDIDAYNANKKRAIMSIGKKKESKELIKQHKDLIKLKIKVANLITPIKTQTALYNQLYIDKKTLYTWKTLAKEVEEGGFPKKIGVGEEPSIE